jgi:hypothetical protein
MLSLQRIRKTQEENERAQKSKRDNYKSPSGFTILSRFMKDKNLEILNKFCDKEGKSDLHREILIEKYHKLNYYVPSVSYRKKNETEQFSGSDSESGSDSNSN